MNKRLPFSLSLRLPSSAHFDIRARHSHFLSTIIIIYRTITLSIRFSNHYFSFFLFVHRLDSFGLLCVFVLFACFAVDVCWCFIRSTILLDEFDRYVRLHKYKRKSTVMVSTEYSFHVTSSPHDFFRYAQSSPPLSQRWSVGQWTNTHTGERKNEQKIQW